MTLQTAHPVAPYLLLAELGAALLGAPPASAEERITLEVIGAVRMASPEAARSASAAAGTPRDARTQEANSAYSPIGMVPRHN